MGEVPEMKRGSLGQKALAGARRVKGLDRDDYQDAAAMVEDELFRNRPDVSADQLQAIAFKRGMWRAIAIKERNERDDPRSTIESRPRLAENRPGVKVGRGRHLSIGSLVGNEMVVDDALEDLPGDLGVVLDLYYRRGYTGEEIAEIFGIKVATVHNKLSKARKEFKQRYGNPAALLSPDV